MANASGETGRASDRPTRSTIRVLNRTMPLPASRAGRIALGSALVVGGALGFLPVVGFWMLPLGLLVLAHDVARVRRWRRRLIVRFARRGQRRTDR
ncbi:hypothetical protein [Oricola sp.]|uniref:hypothetical protein n=1 Tax=Oricola sp. TaxID=1979950 RepID=UPI0025CF67FF|nr:hypothetical protein [Oricola sp.]MCI5073810.1 hypothetical protein [Oricola sp.]